MKRKYLTLIMCMAVLMSAACSSKETVSDADETQHSSVTQATAEAAESADAAQTETVQAPAETVQETETVQATAEEADTAEAPVEAWSPDIPQREEMKQEGYLCAAAYIGFVDPEMSGEECAEVFLNSRYADELAITEIPAENCIDDCGGYELYFVFPMDENASLAVCEWVLSEENDFAGEAGQVYYRSEAGAPVLIRCNVSDIMPNVVVNVVDSGATVQWCPSLSLKDGSMSRYGVEEKVYDMTHYIYNETYECYIIEGEPQ